MWRRDGWLMAKRRRLLLPKKNYKKDTSRVDGHAPTQQQQRQVKKNEREETGPVSFGLVTLLALFARTQMRTDGCPTSPPLWILTPLPPPPPLSVQPMPAPKTTRSTISNLKRRESKKDIATWYIWSILTLSFSPFPLCCRSKCYFAGPVACRLSRSLPKLLYLFFCFVCYHPAFWYYIRKGGMDLFMWFPFVYILFLTI